jgi:hypothetical protein
MALDFAFSPLLNAKRQLLNDARLLPSGGIDLLMHSLNGNMVTGNQQRFVMPFAGEIIEVLHGCTSQGAAGTFLVNNTGSAIFGAVTTSVGPNEDLPTLAAKNFKRGDIININVSAAGTTVVDPYWTIVVVYYAFNTK